MTGDYIKEFLRKKKVSQSEIARKLEMSQQSFNKMLQSDDIKSSLVERVASILHVSMGEIYNEEEHKAVASGNGIAVAGNNNVTGNYASNDSKVLQERVRLLERILDEKERTIQILMKK